MKRSEFYPLDALLDQFDKQWLAGQRPLIEPLLAENALVDPSTLLQELLLIEIECRHRNGESFDSAEYRERFADAAEVVARVFEMLESPDNTRAADGLTHSSSPRHPDTIPGATIGPYQLIRPLGRGAFGEVWLAERAGALATTQVAIKIPRVDPAMGRVLREEAKSWVRASGHPNVVPIIEADVYGSVVSIVSEYVEGGTLESMIQQSRKLSVETAIEIAIGTLVGLEYLHARGIIHRDLKPANILLQAGIPRLTDFGLARQGEAEHGIAGTPAYMAPEAFNGICSIQTDLWSAAIVLFKMLTGHVPFHASSVNEMRKMAREGRVDIPNHVPNCLREALLQGLATAPTDRYKSAADMRAKLSDCRRQLASQDPAVSQATTQHITIAVTGSMDADPERVQRRLQTLLTPYQTRLTTWYTGSSGCVDEVAAEMLAIANQQVLLIGYTEHDMSSRSAELIKVYDLPFVDARGEDVPPEPNAPSQRDIFFATKSDLVILVWDGVSPGTHQLQRWLQQHKRDHQMIYI